MAKPFLGVSTPASPFFTPAPDQSTVSHLKVTVQSVVPKPDGSLQLSVVSGNVRFGLAIFNLPGRPDFKPGDTLILEYPKGQNPLTDYSAIYHADAVTTVPQPLVNRSTKMSEIARVTMTSIELVDYINSERKEKALQAGAAFPSKGHAELRHDHFMDKVPEVLGEAAPKFLGTDFYTNGTGAQVERKVYIFPKREACLMAMSYSYELQAKVFDKMTALEQQALQVATPKPEPKKAVKALPPHTEAFKLLPLAFRAARVIGLDKNAAAISANHAVISITGINVLQLYGTTHIEAERQDTQWFTPTELGKRRNLSAQALNKALETAGLQAKQGKEWELTDSGRAFARLFDTGKKHGNGVPVQQIKWSPTVLQMIDEHKEAA